MPPLDDRARAAELQRHQVVVVVVDVCRHTARANRGTHRVAQVDRVLFRAFDQVVIGVTTLTWTALGPPAVKVSVWLGL